MNQQGRDLKGPRFADILSTAWTQHGLKRVTTAVLQFPKEENRWTTIVHATVETDRGEFSAIGDANPENAGRMIAPHAIRFAESRAIARALRWATNAGEAVDVEMGDYEPAKDAPPPERSAPRPQGRSRVDFIIGQEEFDKAMEQRNPPAEKEPVPLRKGSYSAAELRAFRDAGEAPANLKSAADRLCVEVNAAYPRSRTRLEPPKGANGAELLMWLIEKTAWWESNDRKPTNPDGEAF